MAYTVRDFATKKALKAALANGERVEVFQPGVQATAVRDGTAYLEGPHYPKPHTWYASATVKGGVILKVK
jgi:hypothetical protein